jgi:hypothetical protein
LAAAFASHNRAMPTPQEKTDFSDRLKFSMTRAPEKMRGATDLALHFTANHA